LHDIVHVVESSGPEYRANDRVRHRVVTADEVAERPPVSAERPCDELAILVVRQFIVSKGYDRPARAVVSSILPDRRDGDAPKVFETKAPAGRSKRVNDRDGRT